MKAPFLLLMAIALFMRCSLQAQPANSTAPVPETGWHSPEVTISNLEEMEPGAGLEAELIKLDEKVYDEASGRMVHAYRIHLKTIGATVETPTAPKIKVRLTVSSGRNGLYEGPGGSGMFMPKPDGSYDSNLDNFRARNWKAGSEKKWSSAPHGWKNKEDSADQTTVEIDLENILKNPTAENCIYTAEALSMKTSDYSSDQIAKWKKDGIHPGSTFKGEGDPQKNFTGNFLRIDVPRVKIIVLPIEIVVPQTQNSNEEYVFEPDGSVRLGATNRLAIATLENSFDSTQDHNLKSEWIDYDPDRFYIRVTSPGHSGQGPVRARVWTDSEGTDYDDDLRDSPDSNVVELFEIGTSGVFKSKSMLIVSNDGDDDHSVDGVADNAKNDRTRKIALGGQLRVEFLEYKPNATFQADIEAKVPIEKSVNIKVWVPVIDGNEVVSDANLDADLARIKETLAQAGIAIIRNDTIVKFNHSDAGIDLSAGFNVTGGTTPSSEGITLFDWIDEYEQRGSNEISFIYVNYMTTNWLLGANGGAGLAYIEKNSNNPVYANHIIMAEDKRGKYVAPHELLHILLNAEHADFPAEFNHPRMTWSGGPNLPGINGRKRITKRLFGKQKPVLQQSPYAQ